MTIFETPINNLEYLILSGQIWELNADLRPTYYKKHSAADAWRYRNTPSLGEEVWIPDFE